LTGERVERRLAAVLAADVAGFSRLFGADEEGVLARLRALRAEVINPEVVAHDGRVFKNTGDGFLAEFRSVVSATRCALEIQRTSESRNADLPSDRRLDFRIGIHLGDVIAESDGDLMGDGVNVAVRIEGAAAVGGISLSRAAYEQVRDRLDVAFIDRGEVLLKNIARPVHVFDVANLGAAPTRAAEAPKALALPDKPSIAVLPFQNMSGDPELEYFADGMVEDIITGLSRIVWLFVIARNSSFTYKGKAVDINQVGRELGVRYMLEGSVRKAGNRQLIDAATGSHIWADKFDGAMEDVFDLHDRIAISVAGAIEPALLEQEIKRSRARATDDLTAYDLALRARTYTISWNHEGALEGLALARQAIAFDPNFGTALAIAAWCQAMLFAGGWADDLETAKCEGTGFAWRAARAAPNDSYVISTAAGALDLFDEEYQPLLALIDQALALSPSSAYAWFWSGFLRLFTGSADTRDRAFREITPARSAHAATPLPSGRPRGRRRRTRKFAAAGPHLYRGLVGARRVLHAPGPFGGRPRDDRAASGDLLGQAHADEHFPRRFLPGVLPGGPHARARHRRRGRAAISGTLILLHPADWSNLSADFWSDGRYHPR
jgi:adenylate cyclase